MKRASTGCRELFGERIGVTPDPVPVMVLGRLAVDQERQDQGIGKHLLQDAIIRMLQAAEIAGVKAILVHAISDDVKDFSLARSFLESPIRPNFLCLLLDRARRVPAEKEVGIGRGPTRPNSSFVPAPDKPSLSGARYTSFNSGEVSTLHEPFFAWLI